MALTELKGLDADRYLLKVENIRKAGNECLTSEAPLLGAFIGNMYITLKNN